jgi:hypothetical protein
MEINIHYAIPPHKTAHIVASHFNISMPKERLRDLVDREKEIQLELGQINDVIVLEREREKLEQEIANAQRRLEEIEEMLKQAKEKSRRKSVLEVDVMSKYTPVYREFEKECQQYHVEPTDLRWRGFCRDKGLK